MNANILKKERDGGRLLIGNCFEKSIYNAKDARDAKDAKISISLFFNNQ